MKAADLFRGPTLPPMHKLDAALLCCLTIAICALLYECAGLLRELAMRPPVMIVPAPKEKRPE